MTKYFLPILFIFLRIVTSGQVTNKADQFILTGQITDYPNTNLVLYYKTKSGISSADTIQLKKDGTFLYSTNDIKAPSLASLNSISIFVAPGYELNLTANGKDQLTFYKSKTITGKGSESNRYLFQLDSVALANMGSKSYYDLDESNAVKYIQDNRKIRDSLAHVVFDRTSAHDKYLTHFGQLSRLDNLFLELDRLVTYLNLTVYDYSRYEAFVKKNFDNRILDNLYKDEYFLSAQYKDLMANQYIDYLLHIDYGKDSSLRKHEGYELEKISKTYKGKIKEYVLFAKLNNLLTYSKSLQALNKNKKKIEPYFSEIYNVSYKNVLEAQVNKSETQLVKTIAGKPAPQFTAESNTGIIYSLSDFKGKVIYLDLWASWCHPCREETPSLAKLYEKYRNNNKIAFVSISLDENLDNWKNALKEDKPNWLQLIDKNNTVSTAYVANVIPQFVIIDKNGNIVNFDAPRPSNNIKLEKILNEQVAK